MNAWFLHASLGSVGLALAACFAGALLWLWRRQPLALDRGQGVRLGERASQPALHAVAREAVPLAAVDHVPADLGALEAQAVDVEAVVLALSDQQERVRLSAVPQDH